jgi:predicted nucleotidyltransferase
MTSSAADRTRDLPAPVAKTLDEVVEVATRSLGETLRSIVLFGSGAENRLRATSDVNVLIVVTRFDPSAVDSMRPVLQGGHAAVRLAVMWLLEEELRAAVESFAVKFADIARRHRVVYGSDPFEGLTVSRHAALFRVRQVLLNLVLRMRASYALERDREERLAILLADVVGPLRAGAAEILDLEGTPAPSAREALEQLSTQWSASAAPILLERMRTARETRRIEPGLAPATFLDALDFARFLHRRADALS